MTDVEDRLRDLLHGMAEEVRPAPLLERLEDTPAHPRRQRLVIAAAACAVAVAAAGGLVLVRSDQPGSIEPATQPPKVLHFSGVESPRPGAADLAVFLGSSDSEATPAYLWTGDGPATLLPPSAAVPAAYTQHLSADGTRLVRQNNRNNNPQLEVVDLVTGELNDLNGSFGYCPTLSPDNQTVVVLSYSEPTSVELVDVTAGTTTPLTLGEERDCGHNTFAWSPDGRRLMTRSTTGSLIVDLNGTVLGRIEGGEPSNGSMSWSPDGSQVLVYRRTAGDFALADSRTGDTVTLSAPVPFARPLGWTGSRIVWLTGDAGDQSLMSTNVDGSDAQTWARFDADEPVLTVEWSRELTGSSGR